MPLIPGVRTLIEIPVTERVFGDTAIKQKVVFNRLLHHQYPDGQCSAIVDVTVRSYASRNGGYGESLADKGVPDRNISLIADNNTIVDAATGEILAIRTFETEEDWVFISNSFEQNVMYQGDFFEMMRDNAPLVIGNMIRQHILAADSPPFSRFIY